MKKSVLLITAILCGIIFAHAQSLENSLLWKITGNDLDGPSYLYGTFHLLCPGDLVISGEAADALKNSEQLVLELDFDDPGMLMAMQQGMFMKDGTTAKDYLDEEEYALVSDFFTSKMGLPFEQLSGLKPFFLSSMTLLYFLDCQPASPEQRFTEMAGEQGIEVLGLETVEEQLGFIDDIPLEDAAEMLVTGIEDLEDSDAMTDEMVSTYLEGDLDGIQEIIDTYMGGEYAEISEDLVTARNRDWIPKIEMLIREKPSFIAFGAGHLPGEQGVIQLLRQEGYSVDPIAP
ncbi:MAG: TraB/GumN family protein [Bacteroidales bacterium]